VRGEQERRPGGGARAAEIESGEPFDSTERTRMTDPQTTIRSRRETAYPRSQPRLMLLPAPHPWPWLLGSDHRRALAYLLLLDPAVCVADKLARCEEYRDRWSDRDLLAALRIAAGNGPLEPALGRLLRELALRAVAA
jgi:hypothetical protein